MEIRLGPVLKETRTPPLIRPRLYGFMEMAADVHKCARRHASGKESESQGFATR